MDLEKMMKEDSFLDLDDAHDISENTILHVDIDKKVDPHAKPSILSKIKSYCVIS